MKLLLSIIVVYFVIGFVVCFSMIKNVRYKHAFVKANIESEETKFMVWGIAGITIWGVVGIFLIVWWFLKYFG